MMGSPMDQFSSEELRLCKKIEALESELKDVYKVADDALKENKQLRAEIDRNAKNHSDWVADHAKLRREAEELSQKLKIAWCHSDGYRERLDLAVKALRSIQPGELPKIDDALAKIEGEK